MKSKLGVVLSGGGAKGAYEAGFLKCLAELNIQPDAIAGTSIGALNGSLYAAHKNTEQVAILMDKIWKDLAKSKALQIKEKTKFLNIIDVITFFSPIAPVSLIAKTVLIFSRISNKNGALTTKPVENLLEKYAPVDKILKGLPFYVGVTESGGDLIDTLRVFGLSNSGITDFIKVQSLKSEDMHNIILASAALPILFDAIEVNGTSYRDGGLSSSENDWGLTPAKPLITEEKCTHLIVCHLKEGSFFNRHDDVFNNINIIEIRPKSGTFNSILDPLKFNVDKFDEWMNQGYQDAKRILVDSLDALRGKYERIISEYRADKALNKLKSKKFKLSDK